MYALVVWPGANDTVGPVPVVDRWAGNQIWRPFAPTVDTPGYPWRVHEEDPVFVNTKADESVPAAP